MALESKLQGIVITNPQDIPPGPHWAILEGPFTAAGISYPDGPPPPQYMTQF